MKKANSYIHLEATYPHKLLLCLKEICQGDKNLLKNREKFLTSFQERFPDCPDEWSLLKTAYEQEVIDAFFAVDDTKHWQKRVIIQRKFLVLMGVLSERSTAVLLESLMFLFHWDFFVKVKRRWNISTEEQALFHAENLPAISPIPENHKISEIKYEHIEQLEHAVTEEKAPLKEEIENGNIPTDSILQWEEENISEENKTEASMLEKSVLDQKPEETQFYPIMSLSQRRVLKRALEGDKESQYEMGTYYADPSGSHQNYREAIRWYEVAAEQGMERALFEVRRIYDINGVCSAEEKNKALQIYTKLATRGYPTAQCILGMKYRLGDGVEEDLKEAEKWLKKSALQGHDAAVRNLADLYRSIGEINKAKKWYGIGAANGDEYCIRGFGRKMH